jgi:hypothetical protein
MRRSSARVPCGERGIGLMEIIVATLIATVAVLGLAYTIGSGRGLVNRYEIARGGLAEAQRRLEMLTALSSTNAPELTIPAGLPGVSFTEPFVWRGATVGVTAWDVDWITDVMDSIPNNHSLRKVTVRVTWATGADSDAVTLQRYFPAY